jgi:D-alanine-D-alanine ligase
MALTLHKGLTKRIIRDLGLPTPDFALIERIDDADRVTLPCPRFVKPVAEGTSKGINPSSKVSAPEDLRKVCQALLGQFEPPLLVETFLPGREFTVGIVGSGQEARVLGVLEVHLREQAEAEIYSYENKRFCESLVEYRLAGDALAQGALELALAAWRGLGCRDGGRVDIRADDRDRPSFLEVNPLAGLHPDHSDLPILCHQLGIPYVTLIAMIVESALRRRPGR